MALDCHWMTMPFWDYKECSLWPLHFYRAQPALQLWIGRVDCASPIYSREEHKSQNKSAFRSVIEKCSISFSKETVTWLSKHQHFIQTHSLHEMTLALSLGTGLVISKLQEMSKQAIYSALPSAYSESIFSCMWEGQTFPLSENPNQNNRGRHRPSTRKGLLPEGPIGFQRNHYSNRGSTEHVHRPILFSLSMSERALW